MQDLSKTFVSLSCTSAPNPGYRTITINETTITSPSSFTTTETEKGWISGKAVKITSTVSGSFEGSTAAGSYSQEIDFEDGSGGRCLTGLQAWKATFDTQGSQAASTARAGSYSGSALTFYVSPDGNEVQDLSKTFVTLSCSSNEALGYKAIAINSISIVGLTTFTGTETEYGWINAKAVKITATVTGHFHGFDSSGDQRASGSYVEEIAFEDGSNVKCTSNAVSWSAKYDGQGAQSKATPRAGAYSGSALTFSVSGDGAAIENVSRTFVTVSCSSGLAVGYQAITIDKIPITGLTTFTKTQIEGGILGGKAVKFTSTFTGHFHGLDLSGNQRVAGTYVEEITYEDGSGVKCTSNAVSWSALS
ncbi:MAG: hypothetical protein JWO21_628 [Solirubrobacterales bacterium]|nr:hypothetical protein [Solirubrobacterales bacterium]